MNNIIITEQERKTIINLFNIQIQNGVFLSIDERDLYVKLGGKIQLNTIRGE